MRRPPVAKQSDAELLAELGVAPVVKLNKARTARDERIIAGFEDIVRFYETHGRVPLHGDERDIFERLYAVRLDRLRAQPDCLAVLEGRDKYGLLTMTEADPAALTDDDLMAALGVEAAPEAAITTLRHVTSREDKRAAEEIADRTPCADFEMFEPLFARVKADLAAGVRLTRTSEKAELALAGIKKGAFFIVGGQTVYVADGGDEFVTEYDRKDRRLRVVYDNGTESNVLARSLQKALYRDGTGRLITEPDFGPLFGNKVGEGDLQSGTIYVLRSHSTHPVIAANRDLIHKIGVTGGTVEARIAQAEHQTTYLLAGVEIVADWKLYNINRGNLEAVIHRVFAAAQINLTIEDGIGSPVQPREWFLAPLSAIDQAVERIKDQTIVDYTYDPAAGTLVRLQTRP